MEEFARQRQLRGEPLEYRADLDREHRIAGLREVSQPAACFRFDRRAMRTASRTAMARAHP